MHTGIEYIPVHIVGFILVPVCIWGFVSCDPRMHKGIQYAYGDYCMHIVRDKIQWEYNIITMLSFYLQSPLQL